MYNSTADIVDIFSSVQGEGIFLGARQIFIRFKGCNLSCKYCDEARDKNIVLHTPESLLSEVKILAKKNGFHHSVSLTGGEPLCYTDFLLEFLPLLHKAGIKSYLETNGTLPEELSKVIDFIDIIAMDFKLPSSTLGEQYWSEHERFLKISSRKKVFVKVVVTPNTSAEDIQKAIDIINRSGKQVPFILQPATPVSYAAESVKKEKLLEFVEMGISSKLDNIRVIPQVHKIMGIK